MHSHLGGTTTNVWVNALTEKRVTDRIKSYSAEIVNRSQNLDEKVARLRVLASPQGLEWLTGKVSNGDSGVSPSPESVAVEFEHAFSPPKVTTQRTGAALGQRDPGPFDDPGSVEMARRKAELLNKKNQLEQAEILKARISEAESLKNNPWAGRLGGTLDALEQWKNPTAIDPGNVLSENWRPPGQRAGADAMTRHFEAHPSFMSGSGPGAVVVDGETINGITQSGGPKMAKAARIMTDFFNQKFGK